VHGPRRRRSAAGSASRCRVRLSAQVAVVLKQSQRGVEVAGLAEAGPGRRAVHVTPAHDLLAEPPNQVEDVLGVTGRWIFVHLVEGHDGVVGEVVGQPDGCDHAAAADGLGPAVVRVGRQVQQPSQPSGGTQPMGGAGQFGGGLKRTVTLLSQSAAAC
jgi:hypothetical protein